jgi:hypothetical protein
VILDAVFSGRRSVAHSGWFDVLAPQVVVYALFVAVAGLPVATLAGARQSLTQREMQADREGAGVGPEAKCESEG